MEAAFKDKVQVQNNAVQLIRKATRKNNPFDGAQSLSQVSAGDMMSSRGSGKMNSIIKLGNGRKKSPSNKSGTSVNLNLNYGTSFGPEKLVNTLNPKKLQLDRLKLNTLERSNVEIGLPRTAESPTRLSKP